MRNSRNSTDEPRVRSRRNEQLAPTKVDLHELTPDVIAFLGQAAYVQLTIFENLSRAVATAPTTEAKSLLSVVAGRALDKHHGLTAEISKRGEMPGQVMDPFTARVDDFQRHTGGSDWLELLVTCYVTAGFLDDFFAKLAVGLPADIGPRMAKLIGGPSDDEVLTRQILQAIDANPRLASRLAMWGRRLVGDTMLVARGALALSPNHDNDEARIEPVFTELIAAHTRRMDALGLTA